MCKLIFNAFRACGNTFPSKHMFSDVYFPREANMYSGYMKRHARSEIRIFLKKEYS